MYQRLGFEVVYATFPFHWNDPDLRYPHELHQLADDLPVAHHLACRVRINDRWVLLDATWDRPLKRTLERAGRYPLCSKTVRVSSADSVLPSSNKRTIP